MQLQERQLINDLSSQLQNSVVTEKDVEANELIQNTIANQKDVVYRLVQAVLLQQLALKQAQQDIKSLQEKTQQAESSGKSFLGGLTEKLFGGQTATGNRVAPTATLTPQPNTNAPLFAQSATSGNSFLASAFSTALGVAGGMALFEGISGLFQHNSGNNFYDTSAADSNLSAMDNSSNSIPDPALNLDSNDIHFDSNTDYSYGDSSDNGSSGDFGSGDY